MKIKDLLIEAPLPDEWDKEIYDAKIPFKTRVDYAKKMAVRLGTGSSRIAFIIPYQGRDTVLKIAKNKKGIAQNEYEADLLGDYYIKGLEIAIPMIDYDEVNSEPTWIHVEKAEKMTPTKFNKFFETTPDIAINYITDNLKGVRNLDLSQVVKDNEYLNNLMTFIGSYDISPNDLNRLANWGVYKNKPVIIDLGASKDIITKYYSK